MATMTVTNVRRAYGVTPEIYFSKPIDNARLVKVADPRYKREMAVLAGALALLLALILVVCFQHYSAIEYGYRNEALQQQCEQAREARRQLQLDEARLREPWRIDEQAHQLGLQPPAGRTGGQPGYRCFQRRRGDGAGRRRFGDSRRRSKEERRHPGELGMAINSHRLRQSAGAPLPYWRACCFLDCLYRPATGRSAGLSLSLLVAARAAAAAASAGTGSRPGHYVRPQWPGTGHVGASRFVFAVPGDVPDHAHGGHPGGRRAWTSTPRRFKGEARFRENLRLGCAQGRCRNQSARIRELNLKGIYFQKEPKRFYPKRELAAQVLGYVGLDDEGLGGMELNFDDDPARAIPAAC